MARSRHHPGEVVRGRRELGTGARCGAVSGRAMTPAPAVDDFDARSFACLGALNSVEIVDLDVRDLERSAPYRRTGFRHRGWEAAVPSVAFDAERKAAVFEMSDKTEGGGWRNREEVVGSNANVVCKVEQKRLPGAASECRSPGTRTRRISGTAERRPVVLSRYH